MNRLKDLRIGNNLKQKDICALMQIAKSTYSYWENGRTEPDQASLIKLATYYNVSVDYLLGRTDNPNQTGIEIESWLQQELDGRQISEKLKKLTEEQKQAALNIFQESVNAFYKDRK